MATKFEFGALSAGCLLKVRSRYFDALPAVIRIWIRPSASRCGVWARLFVRRSAGAGRVLSAVCLLGPRSVQGLLGLSLFLEASVWRGWRVRAGF
jgi:hypothetical protein